MQNQHKKMQRAMRSNEILWSSNGQLISPKNFRVKYVRLQRLFPKPIAPFGAFRNCLKLKGRGIGSCVLVRIYHGVNITISEVSQMDPILYYLLGSEEIPERFV